jgi:hypothetical protein
VAQREVRYSSQPHPKKGTVFVFMPITSISNVKRRFVWFIIFVSNFISCITTITFPPNYGSCYKNSILALILIPLVWICIVTRMYGSDAVSSRSYSSSSRGIMRGDIARPIGLCMSHFPPIGRGHESFIFSFGLIFKISNPRFCKALAEPTVSLSNSSGMKIYH